MTMKQENVKDYLREVRAGIMTKICPQCNSTMESKPDYWICNDCNCVNIKVGE